ncbi:MAG: sigma-54-dependent transcriptional regulator [Planctomycetota bacterium]
MSHVLVVDDDAEMRAMLAAALRRRGYEVTTSRDANNALGELSQRSIDAIVTDLRMRGLDGVQLCDRVLANYPGLPVIVMTAFGSMDAAVAALRAGAADFLAKPFKPDVLDLTLRRVLAHQELVEEVSRLRERLEEEPPAFGEIVGQGAAVKELCQVLDRVAPTEANVLILGETGTGKELAARAIHERSPRAGRPFVALNCAAVPPALLESELFGHQRGAFTDARTARAGLFQRASGGTVFLDEIGDMPLTLQVKLLRVLQERTVRPLGSDKEVPVDVRLLAATHRDLEEAVASGDFREDLYYRLNVVQVQVPPLRARGNDVLLLAQHFLDRFAQQGHKPVTGFSTEVARRLLDYDWPGNIRELSNTMERAVALTDHDRVIVEDLPPKLRDYRAPAAAALQEWSGSPPAAVTLPPLPAPSGEEAEELVPLQVVERRHIERVLEAVGGNKARAARILGLDRKTLYRRLEQWMAEGS